MITEKDFDGSLNGVVLKEKGMTVFIKEWENKLSSTLMHRGLKRNVSYKTLIRLELYKLEKHFMGETDYKPFVARW